MSRNRFRKRIWITAGLCAGLVTASQVDRLSGRSGDPLIRGMLFPAMAGEIHDDSRTSDDAEALREDELVYASVLSASTRVSLTSAVWSTDEAGRLLPTLYLGRFRRTETERSRRGVSNQPMRLDVPGPINDGFVTGGRFAFGESRFGGSAGSGIGGTGFSRLNPIAAEGRVPPSIVGSPVPMEPSTPAPAPIATSPVAAVPLPPALPLGIIGLGAVVAWCRRK